MRARAFLGSALLAIALAHGQPAHAEPPAAAATEAREAARQTFFEALAEQEAGRFDQALALYLRVEQVVATPPLLANIGVCEQQLGHPAAALAGFERALARARAAGDPEVRALAETRIAALAPQVARVMVRLAPRSRLDEPRVSLDGFEVPTGAPGTRVDPGAHVLLVRSAHHARAFEQSFEVRAGTERMLDVDLGPRDDVPSPAPPAPSPARPPERPATEAPRSYLPAWVAGGTTVLLGGAAVGTGLVAHDRLSRYETLNAAPSEGNLAEREGLRSSGGGFQIANAVFLGTAVVAAGLTVWFTLRPPRASATAQRHFMIR